MTQNKGIYNTSPENGIRFGNYYEPWQVTNAPDGTTSVWVYCQIGDLLDNSTVYEGGALTVTVEYHVNEGMGSLIQSEFVGENAYHDARRWLTDLLGLAVSLPTADTAEVWRG